MKPVKPKPLTPEAEQELLRFQAAYESNVRSAKRVALSILVWGPSPDRDCPAARKRKEIRDALRELGHNAMFSEDIQTKDKDISAKSKEFAQARAADLILLLLEDSTGAVAEAHDFCNDAIIAPKMFVLIPRRFKKGYSGSGALKDLEDAHGGVFWYGDKDLELCNVCSRAVRRAEALRQMRARGGSVR